MAMDQQQLVEAVSKMYDELTNVKAALERAYDAMYAIADRKEIGTSEEVEEKFLEDLKPSLTNVDEYVTKSAFAFAIAMGAVKVASCTINAYFSAWSGDVAAAHGVPEPSKEVH
jgi:hypothetical protein